MRLASWTVWVKQRMLGRQQVSVILVLFSQQDKQQEHAQRVSTHIAFLFANSSTLSRVYFKPWRLHNTRCQPLKLRAKATKTIVAHSFSSGNLVWYGIK